MAKQPRYNPMEPTAFFADGQSARPIVEGTVARGRAKAYTYSYDWNESQGKENFPADFPTRGDDLRQKLERGRERYNIYCAVCHGATGRGDGMIVQRGFTQPPNFHENRLRQTPPGHIYDVITNGYGAMYPYAARVEPSDRWAIAAYVRALQLSQGATAGDLSHDDQERVKTGYQEKPEVSAGPPEPGTGQGEEEQKQ